jgi:hypothetical protein
MTDEFAPADYLYGDSFRKTAAVPTVDLTELSLSQNFPDCVLVLTTSDNGTRLWHLKITGL